MTWNDWRTFDHYGYALIAVIGTAVAVAGVQWVLQGSRWAAWARSLHGVAPPFINIIGVLFGLTLAFLANDTWSAHDRAMNAVFREADALLMLLASREVAASTSDNVQALMLREVSTLRDQHDQRIGLSQTHVNPLKWLGMAFLGFLTLLSVAVVHVDRPRTALVAIVLFALAAAPTAAIVLVQGNPFQQPTSVSPAPIEAAAAQAQ